MLKTIATVFGVAMLAIGALGFVPGITGDDGMLLGTFHVNPAHNIVHLVTGALALWIGLANPAYARMFFQVFGVIYGVVALLGFYTGDGHILGVIANNTANNWLHVAIAAASLVAGFVLKDEEVTTATSA